MLLSLRGAELVHKETELVTCPQGHSSLFGPRHLGSSVACGLESFSVIRFLYNRKG